MILWYEWYFIHDTKNMNILHLVDKLNIKVLVGRSMAQHHGMYGFCS